MADREKVKTGIFEMLQRNTWKDIDKERHRFQPVLNDALAMLKEQEAVEPILIREGRNKHYNDYVCPRCDNEVVYEQNYCSECGVRFLWEGR